MENNLVPEATLEFAIEKMLFIIKRLIVVIIILIIALIGTNVAWILYENQFETVSSVVNSGDGNANYIGEDGDIANGVYSGDETDEG